MNLKQVKQLMLRKKTALKGESGRVLIIGGSEKYVGAIALVGLAALRAGCDWVTIAAPEKVAWAVNRLVPDIVTKKVKGDFFMAKHATEIVALAEKYDTVIVGPGIGTKPSTLAFCDRIIHQIKKPKVVDADALSGLHLKEVQNAILTPHRGELSEMLRKTGKDFLLPRLKDSPYKEKAATLQNNLKYFLDNNNVLLVKGPTDMTISRNKVFLNRTGNPGMAKAGTGDVLAGLVGGFLAQSGDLFKAGSAGSYINGLVGDALEKKKGYSFIASDIVADLGKLLGTAGRKPKKVKKKVTKPKKTSKKAKKKKTIKKTSKKKTKKKGKKKKKR